MPHGGHPVEFKRRCELISQTKASQADRRSAPAVIAATGSRRREEGEARDRQSQRDLSRTVPLLHPFTPSFRGLLATAAGSSARTLWWRCELCVALYALVA